MKTTTIISTIVVGLAIQALGADPANNHSASASTTTTSKNIVQKRISQDLEPKTPAKSYQIERVGNISSRPWAATAGFSGGSPTPFAGDRERYYEPHFNLFWLGSRPD